VRRDLVEDEGAIGRDVGGVGRIGVDPVGVVVRERDLALILEQRQASRCFLLCGVQEVGPRGEVAPVEPQSLQTLYLLPGSNGVLTTFGLRFFMFGSLARSSSVSSPPLAIC
jgi:hypothetical protein